MIALVVNLYFGVLALFVAGLIVWISKKSKQPSITASNIAILVVIVAWIAMIYNTWSTHGDPLNLLYITVALILLLAGRSKLKKKST